MANHANIESPLVAGPTVKLDSLFADWTFVRVAEANGRHYPAPDGYYLFHGLPGSLGRDRALFVKPHEAGAARRRKPPRQRGDRRLPLRPFGSLHEG